MNVKVISRFTLLTVLGAFIFLLAEKTISPGQQVGPSILKKEASSIMLNLKIKKQDQDWSL